MRPKVKDHYRADKMALWSKLIPELLSNQNGKIYGSHTGDDDDGNDEDDEGSLTNPLATGGTCCSSLHL